MNDQITIKNLEVYANHGVFPEEQKLGQKFIVSAILYTDTRKAGKTDDLEASIDYGTICQTITCFLKQHTYSLLERAAEMLAEDLLLHTKGLSSIQLEIKSPGPPSAFRLKQFLFLSNVAGIPYTWAWAQIWEIRRITFSRQSRH